MPADARERFAHRLVGAICALEQDDAIDAMIAGLRQTLNGTAALQYLRLHPRFAAEAVTHALLRKKRMPKKGGTRK